ncbi:hypothetical protein ACP70R_007713 [Stipagrostis hirtigluma subsp. patula]
MYICDLRGGLHGLDGPSDLAEAGPQAHEVAIFARQLEAHLLSDTTNGPDSSSSIRSTVWNASPVRKSTQGKEGQVQASAAAHRLEALTEHGDLLLLLLRRRPSCSAASSTGARLSPGSVAAMNYIIGAFKPPCDIFVTFSDERSRKQVPIKKDNGKTAMVPAFQSLETIAGEVSIAPVPGKRLEHTGVKIELLGQIELYFDRGNFYDFTSLVRELDIPGEIYERKTYPFEFSTVEMPYESYNGTNVRLRYILKVTIGRNYVGNIVECRDFCVRNYSPVPTINNSIKMEVGIEDCLHIEFEYSKSKYHLKDVIVGKIYFLLVRIKIKNMELEIRRRESTGSGPNTYVETETLAKFELMDGAPVRGESIPVRLFLTPYELTPTYRNINNKFSVKYYLNLVLVDEEDRRYFKQQEITMYRLLETPQSS